MTNKGQSHSFGDVDYKLAKEEIEKILRELVRELQELGLTNHYYKRAIQSFDTLIVPTTVLDEAKLPIISHDGTAKNYSKQDCVVSLFSYTVRMFWDYYNQRDDAKLEIIQANIDKLLDIVTSGLKTFNLKQNEHLRWRLEKK